MNQFTYSTNSWQQCDGDGEHCEDFETSSTTSFGLGLTGGYLLTDMVELGLGAGLGLSSSKFKNRQSDYEIKSSDWSFSGQAYGKLHFGSDPKLVPFLGGGASLDVTRSNVKYGGSSKGLHGSSATLWLSGDAGVDYYVAPKYAITGSLGIAHTSWASDDNTNNGHNTIYAQSNWTLRIGLGVSTYF
jgi:hypothetical protein